MNPFWLLFLRWAETTNQLLLDQHFLAQGLCCWMPCGGVYALTGQAQGLDKKSWWLNRGNSRNVGSESFFCVTKRIRVVRKCWFWRILGLVLDVFVFKRSHFNVKFCLRGVLSEMQRKMLNNLLLIEMCGTRTCCSCVLTSILGCPRKLVKGWDQWVITRIYPIHT